MQSKAETALFKRNPGKFPEPMGTHLKRAIGDWRAGNAPQGLLHRIHEEFTAHKKEMTRKDPVSGEASRRSSTRRSSTRRASLRVSNMFSKRRQDPTTDAVGAGIQGFWSGAGRALVA